VDRTAKQNAALQQENAVLVGEVAELKQQLALSSKKRKHAAKSKWSSQEVQDIATAVSNKVNNKRKLSITDEDAKSIAKKIKFPTPDPVARPAAVPEPSTVNQQAKDFARQHWTSQKESSSQISDMFRQTVGAMKHIATAAIDNDNRSLPRVQSNSVGGTKSILEKALHKLGIEENSEQGTSHKDLYVFKEEEFESILAEFSGSGENHLTMKEKLALKVYYKKKPN
jgi:hypothetical protein